MDIQQILMLGLMFVVAVGLAFRLIPMLWPNTALKRRIDAMVASEDQDYTSRHWVVRLTPVAKRLAKFATPSSEDEGIGVRMLNAGIRSEAAPSMYYAAKTALLLALPFLAWLLIPASVKPMMRMLGILAAAAAGMYLPNTILNNMIKRRQGKLVDNLADALEMMRVCVEAGLGFDAAMVRVTRELGGKCPELKDEFDLTLLEVNAGSGRDVALRRLALRTGVDDILSLTTMLIQADRFGISVGDALKTYTKELRSKRQQRAEEKAAKLSVTLLLPMVLFIFPAMFGVLIGPGILRIVRILSPAMTGG